MILVYWWSGLVAKWNGILCFLLGSSPASELYMLTFRNTVCSIFIGRWYTTCRWRWNRQCSETSVYIIQMPGNYPKENIIYSERSESLKSRSEMVFAISPSSSVLLFWLCIRASALLLMVWGMALLEIQKCELQRQFMVPYFSCCMHVVSPFTVCGECFLLYRSWKLKCPSTRQRTRGKGSALSHLNLNKLSRNCSNHQSNPLMARR